MSTSGLGIDPTEWARGIFAEWRLADFYAIQFASRAQVGFQFLTDLLNKNNFMYHEVTSAPISRQIYILISYNFELLLEAAVCASSSLNTESELEKEVNVSHQLGSLWGKVKKDVKILMQIKRIKPPKEHAFFEEFEVHLNSGEIIMIPEFKNIRYDVTDFRGRESLNLRSADIDASAMVFAIKTFAGISKMLTSHLYAKYKRNLKDANLKL